MLNDLRSVWASLPGVNAPHQIKEEDAAKPAEDGFAYVAKLSYDDSNINVIVQGSAKLKGLLLQSHYRLPDRLNVPETLLSLLSVVGGGLLIPRMYIKPRDGALAFEVFLPCDITDASAKTIVEGFVREVRGVMKQVAEAVERAPKEKTILFADGDNFLEILADLFGTSMPADDKPAVKH